MTPQPRQAASEPMNYRDMTDEQCLAWGREESAARIADLAVRSADGLRIAQANADVRRKAIGATSGQAADMVIRANRGSKEERSMTDADIIASTIESTIESIDHRAMAADTVTPTLEEATVDELRAIYQACKRIQALRSQP